MSAAAAVHTTVGALAAIEEHLGAPPALRTPHGGMSPARPEITRIPEIESCGSTSSEELNAFVARRGLSMSFRPFGRDEAGAVSVLDLLVAWTAPGDQTIVVTRDQQQFPAVRLPASLVTFRRASRHPAPIAVLRTVSGDSVYLTPLASPDSNLVALARRIMADLAAGDRFAGVVFPMVDFQVQQNLEALAGLTTRAADKRRVRVGAADQQLSLKMNERGARAEAVTRMRIKLGAEPPSLRDFVIDEPFVVWLQRPGLSAPLFVAHVTREAWRNPKDLAPRLSRPSAT